MAKKRYTLMGMGGTFDHFHDGHRHFLRFAAELAEELLVGVTRPELSQHKPLAQLIESYQVRQAAVKQFCHQAHIPVQVVPLTDAFGPTLEKSPVRALCVTPETSSGADKINELRQKLEMRPLPVYISDFALAENGQPIHSMYIRQGQMNRQGRVYQLQLQHDHQLTESQRHFFSQLQGEIVTEPIATSGYTAVVGDTSLEAFITNHWRYNLGVYDQKTQRSPHTSVVLDQLKVDLQAKNPAGSLTSDFSSRLQTALKLTAKATSAHVLVDGEEDMATVILALLLPLGSTVYYGQKDQGLVALTITEELKDRFADQLSQPL